MLWPNWLGGAKRLKALEIVMWGPLIGFLLGYAYDLVVAFAGALALLLVNCSLVGNVDLYVRSLFATVLFSPHARNVRRTVKGDRS